MDFKWLSGLAHLVHNLLQGEGDEDGDDDEDDYSDLEVMVMTSTQLWSLLGRKPPPKPSWGQLKVEPV